VERSPEAILSGHWVGTVEIAGAPSALGGATTSAYCEINWTTVNNTLHGTLDLPFAEESNLPVVGLRVEASRVRFTVERPAGPWSFDGTLDAGTLQGTVTSTEGQGPCLLAAVADREPASYDAYNGSYRLAPDRVVCVAAYRGEMGCPYPVCTDFATGRVRALFPRGPDHFVIGPAFLAPLPAEATAEFTRGEDGQVVGLRWQEAGRPAVEAARILLRREAVRFAHEEVTLAGTITWPMTAGPHPAVVLIHGSGPQPRDHAVLRWIADFFALNGIAVLGYDKRGVGESTGNWNDAGMEDLAGDALAAIALLHGRPQVRPDQVGLWGISQGGWIAPLAAAGSPDVAFIILVSGAGVSVVQQDVDRIELTLRTSGYTEDEVRSAVAHQRLFYDAVKGKASWDQLENSVEQARAARWASYVALPTKERFERRAPIVRRFFGYDPAADWTHVRCPVLALFGGRDIIVPPERNVAPLEAALRRGGHTDHTLVIFPEGNHVLAATQTGAMHEIPFDRALVPGYLDTMREWLQARFPVGTQTHRGSAGSVS
jgi:pimeloyl-ACP methyl ester carboxylesterase